MKWRMRIEKRLGQHRSKISRHNSRSRRYVTPQHRYLEQLRLQKSQNIATPFRLRFCAASNCDEAQILGDVDLMRRRLGVVKLFSSRRARDLAQRLASNL